ncbi:hypothetical protein QBC38DRAFT_356163 [Podospora fimiseda]|uniref:Uncharacterized protein n=1 Tax=Podospora fimiseda TaxID=252190 RepID=A0AAN7H378_9PEZI|nr:hypothetical protein QBC38DRAFT_356163 [Podospora fimiseda]
MSTKAFSHSSFQPTIISLTYATLSFHKGDTIRLVSFPQPIIVSIESLIKRIHPSGIQSSGPCGSAFDYKLKGRPFGEHYLLEDYVNGIRIVRDILALLAESNWELVAQPLCSTRHTAKDTLIFRRREPPRQVVDREFLALVPMRHDKLRIVYDVDGIELPSSGYEVTPDLGHIGTIIAELRQMLFEMDYFDEAHWSYESFEFTMKGSPWRSSGEESIKKGVLLLRLLEAMETVGWRLHTTFVHKTGTDRENNLDTWFFVRERRANRGGKGSETSSLTAVATCK